MVGVVGYYLVVNSAAMADTKMVIGYSPAATWTGAFIAVDEGYFKAHGIDAELRLVALTPLVAPALVSGSLDTGGLAVTDLMHAVDAGIDLVAIGGASRVLGREATHFMGMGVFARTGEALAKPQDFIGKKVGVPGFGTVIDISFRHWLFEHGVDLKQVDIVEIPFPRGSDALKTGLVDAVVSAAPFGQHIIEEQTGYLAVDYSRDSEPTLGTVYVTTRDWSIQHAHAVKGFEAALAEASTFQDQNPDATRAIIAKYTKLPPQAQAGITLVSLQATVTATDLKQYADQMVDLGLVKQRPDLAKLVTP